MNALRHSRSKFSITAALLCLLLVSALLLWSSFNPARAQSASKEPEKKDPAEKPKSPAESASTNSPAAKPDAAAKPSGSTSATGAQTPQAGDKPADGAKEAPAKTDAEKSANPDEIQLSFQGANIDMVVQWLAQTTGKSVVKHPQVQCQLNIVSSKKISQREAINLVYNALCLEGFTAVESS